jgi:hypothetical protein
MAFGHKDTDAIFEVVKMTLSNLGIVPIRIDKVEHNEDIDKRIISEIEGAHFLIADLTYSRPSVYFEAGYGQREVPVIYTSRNDHFKDKPDDPHGSLRVHFDLQMKNIIPWASPTDRNFSKRLKARIKQIVAPVISQKLTDEKLKTKIAQFNRLSLRDKKTIVMKTAVKHFRKLEYGITHLSTVQNTASLKMPRWASPAGLTVPQVLHGATAAVKQSGRVFHFVFVHAPSSVTSSVSDAYRAMDFYPLYSSALREQGPPPQVKEDFIICSLGSGGFNRLRRNIPYLRAGIDDQTLVCERPLKGWRVRRDVSILKTTTFHLFESTPVLLALAIGLSNRFK